MDVLIFIYAVGVAIVGGIYAWTFKGNWTNFQL